MISFTLPVTNLRTSHDGDHKDAVLSVDHWPNQGIVVQLMEQRPDGTHYNPLANYEREDHRFWQLNPGLRDRIKQQMQAYTLVGG